jgi:hypothetical protein
MRCRGGGRSVTVHPLEACAGWQRELLIPALDQTKNVGLVTLQHFSGDRDDDV